VVVYERGSQYYLETHDIHETKQGFVWSEGKPFKKEALGELAMNLGNDAFQPMEIQGIMPEKVLYFKQTFSSTIIVWHCKPERRFMYFDKKLNLENKEYNLPALIFHSSGDQLNVYALKEQGRPTLKSELFKAPFYNVDSDGDVCMGNTTEAERKNVLEQEINRWERRFFGSRFTHVGGENVAKGHNLHLMMKKAATEPFPLEGLSKHKYKTVNDLLKRIRNEEN